MAKYLSNAFSLQMLVGNANINVIEVQKEQVPFNELISTVGHQDIANLLAVKLNRVNTRIEQGDILYVAQYIGDRLPEGCVKLPDGATIKYFKVTLDYNLHAAEDIIEEDIPSKVKILRLITNAGISQLEFDSPVATPFGYITAIGTNGVEYRHGELLELEQLTEDDLDNLVYAVELQIDADEKAFNKSQGQ